MPEGKFWCQKGKFWCQKGNFDARRGIFSSVPHIVLLKRASFVYASYSHTRACFYLSLSLLTQYVLLCDRPDYQSQPHTAFHPNQLSYLLHFWGSGLDDPIFDAVSQIPQIPSECQQQMTTWNLHYLLIFWRLASSPGHIEHFWGRVSIVKHLLVQTALRQGGSNATTCDQYSISKNAAFGEVRHIYLCC